MTEPTAERDSLIDFVSQVSGETYLKVEENLGDGFVRLRISEAERRQAKHDIRGVEDIVVELLRNSRDAHAQRIFIASSREGDVRSMTFIDDGVGVPPAMHDRIFEPRVTSKLDTMVMDQWGVHGRGMALFSIRSNSSSAAITTSDLHKGTSVRIVTDAAELGERADQSTWPTIDRDDSGRLTVARGPHNIVRRVVEFSVENPDMDVYFGSPAEVVATLVAVARESLEASELLFADLGRLCVWQRPAGASDAVDLVTVAEELGLAISERTSHRILNGEVKPVLSVLESVSGAAPSGPSETDLAADIYKDRRGLKIHHTDLADFRRDLQEAFEVISERYYLHLKCEPRIAVGRDEIRVRFDVEKDD
jgi:hypothetical protein